MPEAGGVAQPDRADNDPIVFLNAVAHALDRLDPVAPELLDEFTARVPHVVDVVLPCLAAEFERLTPFELVFDDLQEVTQARTLSALNFLLDEVPSESQAVLVTRTDTELWLARQRLSGTSSRSVPISSPSTPMRYSLSPKTAAHDCPGGSRASVRTDGGVAGRDRTRLALPERVRVCGGHRGNHQRRPTRDSRLPRRGDARPGAAGASALPARDIGPAEMTAPLCDAILETDNSSEVLRELERTNSFVIALDDHSRWYRYHTLFAELLRSARPVRSRLAANISPVPPSGTNRTAATRPRPSAAPTNAATSNLQDGSRLPPLTVSLASVSSRRCGCGSLTAPTRRSRPIPNSPWLPPGFTCFWANPTRPNDSRQLPRVEILDVPAADGATSLRSSLANFSSALASRGIHQMLADAEFVRAAEREAMTRWLFGGLLRAGIAQLLLGRPDEAIGTFRRGSRSRAASRTLPCQDRLPWLPRVRLRGGRERVGGAEVSSRGVRNRGRRTTRTLSVWRCRIDRAGDGAGSGRRPRSSQASVHESPAHNPSHPGARWFNADMNIRWGNISLDLGDRPRAQEHAETARAALDGYPDPGMLPSRLAQLDERLAHPSELTPAEIRILPFFPTHLSVKEVAERLQVSPATVKTHVASVYAKLGATSRSDAVEKMQHLGLALDPVGADASTTLTASRVEQRPHLGSSPQGCDPAVQTAANPIPFCRGHGAHGESSTLLDAAEAAQLSSMSAACSWPIVAG